MKELTLLELKDKRANFVEENERISAKIKVESRAMNEDEDKYFKENEKNALELEILIQEKEDQRKMPEGKKVDMSVKGEKRFSLLGSIKNIVDGKPLDSEFSGLFEEGRSEFAKAGCESEGNLIIPSQTKASYVENRAAIVTGQTTGTTAGGYAVATDWKNVLPPLTNYLVLTQAGATYLTGLKGNVEIPTYSGTIVKWKGEVASASDGAGTWGYVLLNPKRLTAYVDVSKMFLTQDSVGAENMLMANISKAVAVKLESTILGTAAGTVSTQPAGLFYSIVNTAVSTVTYALAVGLETTVNTSNALFGNLGYITSAAGLGILKTTPKIATYGSEFLCEDMTLNGYPVYVTNSCASTTDFGTTNGTGLIFGNWADLIIGQWGGFDILVDPYTQAALGTVRLVVNCYFDAAAARAYGIGFKGLHINK